MHSPTRMAVSFPLDRANIDGPDPEIPLPIAPELVAAFLILESQESMQIDAVQ